ncbi:FRAS1-related extracellular matrix protein 1 [Sparganum proliferum]
MGSSALLPLLCFFYLLSVTGVNCQYSEPQNDGAASDKFSLLESSLSVPRLQVVRGLHAPLLKSHLPIMNRVLKGHVCRIEVEEYAPLFSVVGHLEPKKFDCSFRDGDVTYYHEGNPLLNSDTVRVTIFFFRNNYSIIQTADIAVDIIDPLQPKTVNLTIDGASESSFKKVDGSGPRQSRLSGPQELHVEHVKALSEAIDPAALHILYDANKEDCRISYTSPELTLNAPTERALEQISEHPYQTFWWEPNAGLWSPRMGRPLASGAAIGGSRRWPLFGQVVAFNRTDVKHFDHECQEGLLKGYRYLHRKTDSPGTDYIPIQVTIWKRLPDGKRQLVQRESKYLPVKIAGARPLTPPTIRVFRQVNLTHIGGSFSVLPKDCIVVGTETASREDYLDINVTRIQGPLFAQLVNLRDPTRPVLSFRIQELRKGLIALQLLNYAEMQEKVSTIVLFKGVIEKL